MVRAWRRPSSLYVLHAAPVQTLRVQLMQIVQVVAAIATTEDINLVLVAIGGMHVARAWRHAGVLVREPLELLEIQDVHVVRRKRSLSEPAADDIQLVS